MFMQNFLMGTAVGIVKGTRQDMVKFNDACFFAFVCKDYRHGMRSGCMQ